jgi:ABC-type multidrug transport system ATPase subunit
MEMSNILILDGPLAFLDKEKATKFSLCLRSLKKDFIQILITTQRDDIPIEYDNKIALDRQIEGRIDRSTEEGCDPSV